MVARARYSPFSFSAGRATTAPTTAHTTTTATKPSGLPSLGHVVHHHGADAGEGEGGQGDLAGDAGERHQREGDGEGDGPEPTALRTLPSEITIGMSIATSTRGRPRRRPLR
jgi:hypothetical protein